MIQTVISIYINGHQMIWRKKTVKPNFDCVIVNSDDNLNSDELSYYTKIQVRVTKKLADIQ